MPKIDILAFGAHRDDVEIGCSGLLLKMKKAQHTTGIIDLTQSEMNSRASPETIAGESSEATRILDVDLRQTFNLGDSRVNDTHENRLFVAEIIRKYRPEIILAPYFQDRHIDHTMTGTLVKNSNLFCRLKKLKSDFPPHGPKLFLFYLLQSYVPPAIVVDISNEFETKMTAIKAYKSQFAKTASELGITPIGIGDYVFHIESRSRFYGSLIDVRYGEAFMVEGPLAVDNPWMFI
jgi:bacillithiol biosynthesis deacetylase BshB1